MSVHVPVLTGALLDYLQLQPGARCIDATIDGGGHAATMLERSAPGGEVLGIDRDPEMLAAAQRTLSGAVEAGRLHLARGDFRELGRMAAAHHFEAVAAVVFDLGLSSFHLDASGRGFSFMRDEPLDMRFDPEAAAAETAAQLVNSCSAAELAEVFRSFGVVTAALPARVRWRGARSTARVFQALRIAVNDELQAIAQSLPQALALLAPGGRLAVIAFHSLEDRLVKQFFAAERQAGRVRILTKKPVRPSDGEVAANPRAASAKLRVCERTP
jgi:16S rRNA (cytosine1402-N4)-methyltransferase